ncbi:MAG TPA: uracil-DNA glycosylase family protein [Anaerovoracaceae bacterium]|nr:uracil-DNA glycosylase family protein [Anaerovoracaceae bacterium]
MSKLNDLRFKDLITLALDDSEREAYNYGNQGDQPCVNGFCTSCEDSYGKQNPVLNHILFGSTTQDYIEFLKQDNIDTSNWDETPVMFVFENPGECGKDDFKPSVSEGTTKQIISTWPYIGWESKGKFTKQDFALKDNMKMKMYGELICAAILHYELKNAYVTNLVKCGVEGGSNLSVYTKKVIDNCVENIFKQEFNAINPKVIFAFSKKVEKKLRQAFPDFKNIIYLPHPAARIATEKREELLKEGFSKGLNECS